ncbi:hypothetical protein HCN44_006633 [Aphidius gifuensis]|uniref:Uncharacterized protein n=1 Tax=Aphidius gifuensis TaxID=684658 RepID=A0A834Y065_APHGI|nr:hypothetical protein HCN44_006633 [Aphidius gifuensis]
MASATGTTFEKFIARMKVHHAHHPMITGYAILGSVLTVLWSYKSWKLYHENPYLMTVQKYRRNYIVIRPDDPAVKMIKRGKVGMDY